MTSAGAQAIDVLLSMDSAALSALRADFRKGEAQHHGGIPLHAFIAVMTNHLPPCSKIERDRLLLDMVELFELIDVNDDGTMDWDEFTSFCVEAGMVATRRLAAPLQYQFLERLEYVDRTSGALGISFMKYFPSINRMVVAEEESTFLALYDQHLKLVGKLSPAEALKPKLDPIAAARERNAPSSLQVAGVVLCADIIPLRRPQLVISSSDFSLTFWEVETSKLKRSEFTENLQTKLLYVPQRNCLLSCGVESHVSVWPLQGEWHLETTLAMHTDVVTDLCLVPTHDMIASCSLDHKIILWDAFTMRHRGTLTGHIRGITKLVFSTSNRLLISAGFEFDAIAWDISSRHSLMRLSGHRCPLQSLALVQLGSEMAVTMDTSGIFKLWDIGRAYGTTAVCLQTFAAASSISSFNPRTLCSLAPHKTIVAATGKMRVFGAKKLQLADALPVACCYSRAMAAFFVVSGRTVQTYCARSGRLLEEYHNLVDCEITSCCIDGRERRLIMGLSDGRVTVFNAFNMLPMKSSSAHAADVVGVAYVKGHQCIISAAWDRVLSVHDERDAHSAVACRTMERAHKRDVTRLEFSQRLSLIATSSADYSVRIWDFEMMRLDAVCLGHTVEVTAVCFMDPLPLLISADCSGVVLFWATRPHSKAGKCVYAMKNLSPVNLEYLQAKGKAKGKGKGKPPPPRRAGGPPPPNAAALAAAAGGASNRLDPDDADKRMAQARARRGDRRRRQAAQGDMAPVPVNALANYYEPNSKTHFLITGDERGDVKTWEIGGTCRRLGLVPVNDSRLPSSRTGYNAHRRIERSGPSHGALLATLEDAGMTADGEDDPTHAAQTDPASLLPPGVWSKDVRQQSMWRAHSDCLKDMYVLSKERCLVTTSYDKSVRLWSVTGSPVGVLSVSESERVDLAEGRREKAKWLFRYDNAEAQRQRDAQVRQVMTDIAQARKKAIIEQGREGARRQAREALQRKQAAAKRLQEMTDEKVRLNALQPRGRRPHSSQIFTSGARNQRLVLRPNSAMPGGGGESSHDHPLPLHVLVHEEEEAEEGGGHEPEEVDEQADVRLSALEQMHAAATAAAERGGKPGGDLAESSQGSLTAGSSSHLLSTESFGALPDLLHLRVLSRPPPPVSYGHLNQELNKKMANRAEGAVLNKQMDLRMSQFLFDNLDDPEALVADPGCMSPEDHDRVARRLAKEQEAQLRKRNLHPARPQSAPRLGLTGEGGDAATQEASAAAAEDAALFKQRSKPPRPATAAPNRRMPPLSVDVSGPPGAFSASFSGGKPTTPVNVGGGVMARSMTAGQLHKVRSGKGLARAALVPGERRTSTTPSFASSGGPTSTIATASDVRKERRALLNRARIDNIIGTCGELEAASASPQKRPQSAAAAFARHRSASASDELSGLEGLVDGFIDDDEGSGVLDDADNEAKLAVMRERCNELQRRMDNATRDGLANSPKARRQTVVERVRKQRALRKQKQDSYLRTKKRHNEAKRLSKKGGAAASAATAKGAQDKGRLPSKKHQQGGSKFGSYTSKEVMDVKEMFDQIDTDNSGTISMQEMRASKFFSDSGIESALLSTLRNCAADHQEMTLIELFELTFPLASRKDLERMNLMVEMARPKNDDDSQARALTLDEVEEIRRIFRQFDTEFTGFISIDDVFTVLNAGGDAFLTRKEIADVFCLHESASNDRLSLDEFQALLADLYTKEDEDKQNNVARGGADSDSD